jgi:hypothetical protein
MRVANQLHSWSHADVGFYQLDVVVLGHALHAISEDAAAEHEHSRFSTMGMPSMTG